MTASPLHDFADRHLPEIRRQLQQYLLSKQKAGRALSPHLGDSLQNIAAFSLRGGKFIRSLLVVLSYRLAGGKSTAIYPAAAAIEMFQKFIVSIDDMADRDEKRNDGPTLWKFYEDDFAKKGWPEAAHHGRTFAEIDCLLMSSFVTELLRISDFEPEKILDALEIVDELMYFHTVGGWQIHYFQNQQSLVDASEKLFLKGLELVTADYSFVAPLTIGAILAGADKKTGLLETLQIYGREVGKAFQIQDDILGMFGDSEQTGKPVGNDLREGKKTLLLQRAYRGAKPADQKFLVSVCGREFTSAELQRVQQLMVETGALTYSQKLATKSVQKGITALKTLPNSAEKKVLIDLAHFVVSRKF